MGDGEPTAGGDERWSLASALRAADEFIVGRKFPQMRKPAGLGEDYTFPQNAATVTGVELGSLQLRLESYNDYVLRLLGREEAVLGEMEETYALALGLEMGRIQEGRSPEKRILKEVLVSMAVDGSDSLRQIWRAIRERRLRVAQLRTQQAIYQGQVIRLSREQSRRESEARLGG